MSAGTLPAEDWEKLAWNLRRRAIWLAKHPSEARGWAAQRRSALAAVEALTGLRGNNAAMATVLWDQDVKPVLDQARYALTDQLPASVREAADDFAQYTGRAVSDPNLARSVAARFNDNILHDWDRLEVATQIRIGNALQQGITAGSGPDKLATELRKTVGFTRSRVSTIARTEIAAAQDEMNHQTMRRLGVQEWVWKARPDACPICFMLHGETFKVQEATGRHPNCNCIMVPKVPGVKMPKVNHQKAIVARLPRRLQPPADYDRAALLRRLVVAPNPRWKPTYRLAPPGTTKFTKPKPPQWKPVGPYR